MAAKIYHRPNNVQYDIVAAVVGVVSVSVNNTSLILPAVYDDGTIGKMPVAGAIQGTIVCVAGTNPNTFAHASGGAALGLIAISINSTTQPRASLSDAGTVVSDVAKGFVEVQATFQDAAEADNAADVTTEGDITFNIVGPDGASDTITIKNCKSSSASGVYDHSTGGFVVNYIGEADTDNQMGLPLDTMAYKVTATKNITFDVSDESDVSGIVTLTAVKTGGVSANFTYGGVGTCSLNYVAASESLPV